MGTTIDPWTTQVWTEEVHLHADLFFHEILQYYIIRGWLNPLGTEP